jgi:predicted RNase H-like HicB family nuclease
MKKVTKKTADIKTKYGTFRCVFEPEPDMGGYVVTAPAVPGAISWGRNLAHAKKMVVEAIEGAIEGEIIMAAAQAGQITIRKQKIPVFA